MEVRRNKVLWTPDSYSNRNKPNWHCPNCGLGTLQVKRNFSEPNSFTATEYPDYFSQFPDEQVAHLTGIMICSNDKCKESVVYSGILKYEHDTDRYDLNYDPEPRKVFYPKFFLPALQLFRISKHCPEIIKSEIRNSFSHFFNDRSACANSLRRALELIMDDKGVTASNSKNKPLTLHKRIESFCNTNKPLEPFLLAAKWIGNAGSHAGVITKEALFDGYELLEHCLDELYDKPERMKELSSKATEINAKKKPR